MSDAGNLSLLGLSGSLRSGSINTALLRAAGELAPDGVALTVYDYSDVPLFNEDAPESEAVVRLNAAIAAADGVVIAVPEYNHSLPGVLKNALDHASRPAFRGAFRGKPVAVMSASPGGAGGARAQEHTQVILLALGANVMPLPSVQVGGAMQRFVDGALVDERTRTAVEAFMAAFADWCARFWRSAF